MAMICISGGRECDGCMRCQEQSEPEPIGCCAHCDEPVYSDDDRYEFPDGEIVHDYCAEDYIRAHYYKEGA